MCRKQFLASLVIVGTILVLVLSVSLLLPAPVRAQCGEPPNVVMHHLP